MEHSYIEKHDIVGRYLSGRLSGEELIRFEEHFLGCPQCIDQLETTDDIRSGLRAAAAEEAWPSRTYTQTGLLARAARFCRTDRVIFFATIVLLIAPMVWVVWMWTGTRRNLIEARQVSSIWQRRYEEQAQAASDRAKEMHVREERLSADRDRLAAQLENEREARARLADQLNGAAGEQAVVPVFILSRVREGRPDLSSPIDEITLSSTSKSFILLLEMEPDPNTQSYRAAILTADGRNIWSQNGLTPKSKDGLAISFNSDLLKPDTYLLTLERLTPEGRYKLIAKYTFRVFSR